MGLEHAPHMIVVRGAGKRRPQLPCRECRSPVWQSPCCRPRFRRATAQAAKKRSRASAGSGATLASTARRDGMRNTLDRRSPSSARASRSANRPPAGLCSGRPIGMSTAMMAGRSSPKATSAKRFTMRGGRITPSGRANTASQAPGQPVDAREPCIVFGRDHRHDSGMPPRVDGRVGCSLKWGST